MDNKQRVPCWEQWMLNLTSIYVGKLKIKSWYIDQDWNT